MKTNALSSHLQQVSPCTLPELLSRYCVSVPGIQRHYVQGAEDVHAKEVLRIFLKDLFSNFAKNEPMELDFIFGPLDTNGADTFVPVDGQQRLTTLWLVARYAVARLPETAKDIRKDMLKKVLARFQYADRRYASRFCQALCDASKDDGWAQGTDKPSAGLTKAGILNPGWREDSTVAAMLNAFDTIAELWSPEMSAEDFLVFLWEKVTFRLCMENFTDDLYMKMNARGLTLTQWEKIKGKIAKKVEDEQGWSEQVEKLSNRYFECIHELPDNAFFALLGRISNYLAPEDEKSRELIALASCDPGKELPYVPFEQFCQGNNSENPLRLDAKALDRILWMMDFLMEARLELPSWDNAGDTLLKAFFLPTNAEQRDLSLLLFEYFRGFDTVSVEGLNHSLRLFWNVLNNVSENSETDGNCVKVLATAMQKAQTHEPEECDLYLNEDLSFDSTAVQYREEEAKGLIYRQAKEADAVSVVELQEAEDFLHGRVRMALLDLKAKDTTIAIRHSRIQVLNELHKKWKEGNDKVRQHWVTVAMMAMSYWADDDTFAMTCNQDSLRNLLATRNDKELQVSLLDYLAEHGFNVKPREVLDANPDNFYHREDMKKEPWRRDWQANLLWLLKFCPEEVWRRTVKRHGGSNCFYLYCNQTIHSALPLNDYRFDYRNNPQMKAFWENFNKLHSNDNNDIRVTEGQWTGRYRVAKDRNGREIHVYFGPDKVEISKMPPPGEKRVDTTHPWCEGEAFFTKIEQAITELKEG